MKTRNLHYSAKLRQYRYLAKRIDRAVRDGSFRLLSQNRKRELLRKLKGRLQLIAPIVSHGKMKNALAGVALLLATSVGAQSFAPPVVSPFGIPATENIPFNGFADMDDDGDQDLFIIEYDYGSYGQEIRFYENTGTPEAAVYAEDNFVVNPFGITLPPSASTPSFVDLDNDGDLDIMMGELYGNNFFFFENTGTAQAANFSTAQTNPFGLSGLPDNYTFIAMTDLDGDGDIDLFSTTYYGVNYYFENTGTAEVPAFSAPVSNPFGLSTPVGQANYIFPAFADLDGDGDQDLLSSEFYYGVDLQYYENTGTAQAPNFGVPSLNPFGLDPSSLFVVIPNFVDIDNDGDMDLFASDVEYGGYGAHIVFFENLEIVNQFEPTSSDATLDIDEDEQYAFSTADFPFFDGNPSDELQAVQIVDLPLIGTFTLGGIDVVVDQLINVADLANLQYTPNPNDFGDNYDEFRFKVSDGNLFSVTDYLMTINVAPINDFPESNDTEVGMLSDFDNLFSTSDFPFTDADGDELDLLQVDETVDKGNLTLNGVEVTNGQILSASEVDELTYTPLPGEEGLNYTSFKFKVSDGIVFNPAAYTMTINIVGPNATGAAELDVSVSVSPNPANDVVQLKVEMASPSTELSYAIFDGRGRLIKSTQFSEMGTMTNQEVNVSDYPSGVYFVKIFAEGKMKTVRFVKQ